MIKNIYNFIQKHSLMSVVMGYLLVNILFNTPIFWGEFWNDSSQYSAVIGEINATEWGMEQIYQRLIQFENPFKPFDMVFYPFSVDVSGADIGFGFHFLYLRPFFSPHQSLSFLVVLHFFLANIFMYALLRKLEIRKAVSFVIGLAFGYMTFMTVRLGHLTYSMYYVFPLFMLPALHFISAKNIRDKLLYTIMLAFIFVYILWSHAYYFILILISVATLCLYYLCFYPKKSIEFLKLNLLYLVLGILTVGGLLSFWIIGIKESSLFSQIPRSVGWGGAIQFSSDLFGYFVPSHYNVYYGRYVAWAIQRFDIAFARGIFENFTYPGIIILASYFLLGALFMRGKLHKKLWHSIRGYFIASIVLLSLTLGPFLHVAGRWAFTVDEGIKIVVPLPYVLLHYMPLLNNVRSPGRFIVAFIFLAYLVVAFLLNNYLKDKSKKFIFIALVIITSVVIIDHRYPNNKLSVPYYFPHQIYEAIAKDASESTVLEIPFTVRDGITYFGDQEAIYQIMGQFIFTNPILGGYMGRVPDYIKNYYVNDPFIGYVGRLIDTDITLNGGIDRTNLDTWQVMDEPAALRSVDFLDLKYIIMNTDKPYVATLAAQLENLGYQKIMKDNNYILLEKLLSEQEYLSINLGEDSSKLQLGMGWSETFEKSYKFADEKSSVLFKVQKPNNYTLVMETAAFYQENEVTVFIDKKKVDTIHIAPELQSYTLQIPFELSKGIHIINLVYAQAYRPIDVVPDSIESRKFAAKVYSIELK